MGARMVVVVLLGAFIAHRVEAANRVTLQSKSVMRGADTVTMGVYLQNDVEVMAVMVPLEVRAIDAGSFVRGTLGAEFQGRLSPFLQGENCGSTHVRTLGHRVVDYEDKLCVGNDSLASVWKSDDSTADFASPDAILCAVVGYDSTLRVGCDSLSETGIPSVALHFGVTDILGRFEIDTTCIPPFNHLLYITSEMVPQKLTPEFAKGVIEIGGPFWADSSISGHIDSNVVINGDVVVTGDLTIDSGATLTTVRGSHLMASAFSDDQHGGADSQRVEIIVEGTFAIDEYSGERPLFSSTSDTTGAWYGIRVMTGGHFESGIGAQIKFAEVGVSIESGAEASTLSGLRLEDCQQHGFGIADSVRLVHDTVIGSLTGYGAYLTDCSAQLDSCVIPTRGIACDVNAGTTVWDSTNVLTRSVSVSSGASLIIGPGSTIVAESSYALNVYGNLDVQGTSTDTVRFRAKIANPGRQDWYGIKQLGPGNVSLSYTQVRDAYNGLRAYSITTVDTISVDHCDFRHCQLAGVYIEANASSEVSIHNSHFSDISSYGLEVYKGRALVEGNRFTDAMLYGVFVYGSPSWLSGAKIIGNSFDSLSTSNAYAVYLQSLTNDGYGSSDTTIYGNSFGPTWLGSSGQGAIQINNCSDSDTLRIGLTSIRNSGDTKPAYGILHSSTKTRIFGDHVVAESLSAIQGPRYALYLMSTSGSDPDYATLRNISVRAGHAVAIAGYGAYVYSNSKVNAGTQSDGGGNAFYGYRCQGCSGCGSSDAGASSIYNNNTGYTDPAQGNYWGNKLCADSSTNTYWPYISARVDTTGKLSSNPFSNPLGKLAGRGESEGESQAADLRPAYEEPSNYPNPFNPSTVIEFSLEQSSRVEVAVYNLMGQHVRSLWSGELSEGRHTIPWDGTDGNGQRVASGVYFYRITSGQKQITKKMVVLK